MGEIKYTRKNVFEQALDMETNKTLAWKKLPSYLNQVDCLDDLKVKGSALAKQIQILYNKQKNILISGFEASQYGIYFFFGNKLRIYYAIYYGIPRRILSFHLNNLHKLFNSLKIGLILIIAIGLLIFQRLFEKYCVELFIPKNLTLSKTILYKRIGVNKPMSWQEIGDRFDEIFLRG